MNSGFKVTPVLLARIEETHGSHSQPYHGSARRRKLHFCFRFLTYKTETRTSASLMSYPKASGDEGKRALCRGRQIMATPSTAIPGHLIFVASRTRLPGVHLSDLDGTATTPTQRAEWMEHSRDAHFLPSLLCPPLSPSSLPPPSSKPSPLP